MGAAAEVWSSAPERDVRVGGARDVESVGVVEHCLGSVRGVVEEHDLVAGTDRMPGDLGFGEGCSSKVDDLGLPH